MTYSKANASQEAIPRKEGIRRGAIIVLSSSAAWNQRLPRSSYKSDPERYRN